MNNAAAWVEQLGVPVRALSADSRAIESHTAFLAYPGSADDGRRYIDAAVAAGAAGVFWEAEDFHWQRQWQVPNVAVENLKMECGNLADVVYGAPSRALPVVAITGTNGKTTVSHLAAQLLRHGGARSGVVGTLGAGMVGDSSPSPSPSHAPRTPFAPLDNTTPDAATLHHWLREFVAAGADAAMVEASSHGIDQGRLNGLRLAAAVFTNAAHDHLDYHGDVQSYWQAKAQLFTLPEVGAAILNADDDFCRQLASQLQQSKGGGAPVFTYGKNGAALRLCDMQADAGGMHLRLDGVCGACKFYLPLVGAHNVYNFLAALLVTIVLERQPADVAAAAAALTLPAGRMQQIHRAPAVYIDYAHTPDALAAALAAARSAGGKDGKGGGRLIAVFGAGGERDKQKRADMGRIAAAAADEVVITDDNPRNEDAAAIRAELCAAAGNAKNIGDRREAIAAALQQARREDTVLILGKGHETTQQIGGEVQPFSDAAVVRELVRDLMRDTGREGA